jgi:hypothetical protein
VYQEDVERWRELAKQAVDEQDEVKFLIIIRELNTMLENKLQYLQEKNRPYKVPPPKRKPSGLT